MTKTEKNKDTRLRREYNITLEERTKVFKYQKEACAICGNLERNMKISLSTDHCHTSGLVRGLLCMRCNKAIELLMNNSQSCANAAAYLTNPPFVVVLGKERYTAPGKVGTKIRRKRLAQMRLDEKKEPRKQGSRKKSRNK